MHNKMSAVAAPLRVGIVGCGNISSNHLQAYAEVDGAEVIGVCDVDIARARMTATNWNIEHAVDSVEALLALDLEMISICTPHPTHEAVAIAAAAAGVHVLCEKPIAVDIASAQRMVDACAAAGVKLGVLFQRRFWPAAQQLRSLIDDGTLGEPKLGHVAVQLYRAPEYYAADAWRGTWDADGGGVLMTQAIHYLDLLQWYMGPVAQVYGRINTYKHGDNIDVEDSATAVLQFSSGAMATVNATTATDPGLGVQIRLTGSTGATAELTEFPEGTDGRLTIRTVEDRIDATLGHPADQYPNIDLAQINGGLIAHHQAQIVQFVEAVRDDRAPAVTGTDATNALRILLAIYHSAQTNKPVDFAPLPAAPQVPDEMLDRLDIAATPLAR
ncbi:Gfo/Idh/MocA family oxidoreductase [Yaniella flava]|uniref:Gfo/Idh/MocA family oxidoreductase n=1 Tax=Yaniella flava TaxID=287930 RepID=A0ABP5GAX3_9MICC